jgi:hypothetical protein
MAKLPWSKDGKLKATPTVVLIVVVGVEVKGTSRESACRRFLRNANDVNSPSDSTLLCARFRLNAKRSAHGSRQQSRGHRTHVYDSERCMRRQENLLACS